MDTDVVILAIRAYSVIIKTCDRPLSELWIAFGTGKHFRYIPCHELAEQLGKDALVLPIFHALTGCDTVSYFSGRGKQTAWEVWKSFPSLTDALGQLCSAANKVLSDDSLRIIERFIILLYDRTSTFSNINDARMYLFTKRNRSIEGLPPTYAALIQHIKRAVYQGYHVWGQLIELNPDLPPPMDWGWKIEDNILQPLWTTLPEAAKACYELIHCGCKTNCHGRCKCVQASLQCTALCACNGECNRD